MYTVLWYDEYGEALWDRFETSDEVTYFLTDNNLVNDDSIMIFYPESEYYKTNTTNWIKDHTCD